MKTFSVEGAMVFDLIALRLATLTQCRPYFSLMKVSMPRLVTAIGLVQSACRTAEHLARPSNLFFKYRAWIPLPVWIRRMD